MWSKLLNDNNVQFINQDYKKIVPNKNDFIYLDPPYYNTKGMYFGDINHDELWEWIRTFNFNFILSFNGIRGSANETFSVPNDIYNEHLYLNSGSSSFTRMKKNENILIKESLYLKIKE